MTATKEKPMTDDKTEPVDRRVIAAKLAQLERDEAVANADELSEWRQLVIVASRSGDVDIQQLRKLRRTAAELQEAADLIAERRQWAADLTLRTKCEKEIQDTRRELQVIADEYKVFFDALQVRELAIVKRQQAATGEMSRSFAAFGNLVRTCRDPQILADLAEIDGRMSQIPIEKREIASQVEVKKNAVWAWQTSDEADRYERDITRVSGDVKKLEDQLAALKTEAAALNSRRQRIERELMCNPERF